MSSKSTPDPDPNPKENPMSLLSAFYSGLSGLSTNANALNVIGNNLANINTVGFKGSDMTFRDIFSSTGAMASQGNGNPIQFGLGVQANSVNQDFSQSSFQSTGNAMDMAIQGNGFFTLQTPTGSQVYSRAGNFTRNNLGFLVASDGSSVLGWNGVNGALSTNSSMVPIQISSAPTPAQPTDAVTLGVNLNPADASFSNTIQIYDSLGAPQNIMVTYTNTSVPVGSSPATWNWAAVDATAPKTPIAGWSGTLAFDGTGTLTAPTAAAIPSLSGHTWSNGATTPAIAFNIPGNFTGLSQASTTVSSSQTGFPPGTLQALSVDQNGVITGTFTNGQIQKMAQVAVSTFTNTNGLEQSGNNHWSQTLASGVPTVGQGNQGGRGGVLGSNLELSNVDVASEFTKLITSQRGYEANSKIITTTDQLMQVTLNLTH
jgi:flagellar hook protein FlgE